MAEKEPKKTSIVDEDRIDDGGIELFKSMGYTEMLSYNTVRIYRAYKHKKDMLYPGPMTPEAIAFVATLADMADGKLDLGKENSEEEED